MNQVLIFMVNAYTMFFEVKGIYLNINYLVIFIFKFIFEFILQLNELRMGFIFIWYN